MGIYNPPTSTATIPDLVVIKRSTSANATVTAGYSAYVPGGFEIAAAHYLEISSTSCFEVG
jgi:hypothetical protein